MKLKTLGVDILLEVPFTKQLSVLDPNDFVNKVLHQYFHYTLWQALGIDYEK